MEIPAYYVERLRGAWGTLFLLNLLLNWAIPFFALLPRRAKQSTGTLAKIAIVVLAGRCLDLYLMIMPPLVGTESVAGLWEFGVMVGTAALFALLFLRILGKAPLVPLRDPYLAESLHSMHG